MQDGLKMLQKCLLCIENLDLNRKPRKLSNVETGAKRQASEDGI